jgi:hypothetical protein
LKRLTHGNTRILSIIMPNRKGHEDSIKDSRFKAAWQSGPTRTIRVPIALAEVTLEYARQLDQGIEPRDTRTQFDYVRAFEPKLNIHQNTFAAAQAEELKKRIENLEQCKYDALKKQVENLEQSGDDKDTIIKKIWEAGREGSMVNI